MHKFLILSASLLICLSASGQLQQDPEAKKILDRLSSKSQGDYPLQISFEYVYESLIDKETHSETGSLILEGKRFRLRLGEADVYCDGQTLWNHLTMAGEVYISDAREASSEDDFFLSSPGDLFTFYQEGFNYQLKDKVEIQGRYYYHIYLYPVNPEKPYHTVKLLINESALTLYSAQAMGKHGVNHTVNIREYKRKVSTNENTFVFRPENFPGLEIIDTRF